MDNLFQAAKQYSNAIIANKDRKDLNPIMYNFYTKLIFPEVRKRFTPDELKGVPVSSRDIFEDQIFIDTIRLTNMFELVKFCVKSSAGGILDFLGIPGVAEEEPSIGYDMYMSLILFKKVGDRDYDEAVDLLATILFQLDVIKLVDNFVDGELLDKDLSNQIEDYSRVIDDVIVTQIDKVENSSQMEVLHGLFAGF